MRWFRSVRWFFQRGRRGWADCDIWNLDMYLTRILAHALPKLAEGHGHPCLLEGGDPTDFDCAGGEQKCVCNHNWVVELYRNAELFNRLDRGEFWNFDEEEVVCEEATSWLAKRWRNLWD